MDISCPLDVALFLCAIGGLVYYLNKVHRWLSPKHPVTRLIRWIDGPSKRSVLEQTEIALSEAKLRAMLLEATLRDADPENPLLAHFGGPKTGVRTR